MATQGEPKLIDPDAEELVFKLRLNSIPGREAITSLMLTIVAMRLTLDTVGICTFYFVSVSLLTILYCYSYKLSYYIFHIFCTVWLQVWLQGWLLVQFIV